MTLQWLSKRKNKRERRKDKLNGGVLESKYNHGLRERKGYNGPSKMDRGS